MQGTAATALAGVYGALKVQGKEAHSLTQQRIVVLGAGSAGMGVSTMMAQGMVKHVSTPPPPPPPLPSYLHFSFPCVVAAMVSTQRLSWTIA